MGKKKEKKLAADLARLTAELDKLKKKQKKHVKDDESDSDGSNSSDSDSDESPPAKKKRKIGESAAIISASASTSTSTSMTANTDSHAATQKPINFRKAYFRKAPNGMVLTRPKTNNLDIFGSSPWAIRGDTPGYNLYRAFVRNTVKSLLSFDLSWSALSDDKRQLVLDTVLAEYPVLIYQKTQFTTIAVASDFIRAKMNYQPKPRGRSNVSRATNSPSPSRATPTATTSYSSGPYSPSETQDQGTNSNIYAPIFSMGGMLFPPPEESAPSLPAPSTSADQAASSNKRTLAAKAKPVAIAAPVTTTSNPPPELTHNHFDPSKIPAVTEMPGIDPSLIGVTAGDTSPESPALNALVPSTSSLLTMQPSTAESVPPKTRKTALAPKKPAQVTANPRRSGRHQKK